MYYGEYIVCKRFATIIFIQKSLLLVKRLYIMFLRIGGENLTFNTYVQVCFSCLRENEEISFAISDVIRVDYPSSYNL